MFIIPLGIEAKTVNTPWATFAVVVVISFVTILNRNLNDQLNEIYLHSTERLAYQRELKGFLDERCSTQLRDELCEEFQRGVLPEHLMSVEVFKMFMPLRSEADAKELLTYVGPWLDEDKVPRLAETSPKFLLVKEKLLALNERVSQFTSQHQILGTENFSAEALLKSQFLHSGFMHLMGNLVFLLLLAFPVEQRLGWSRYLAVYFLAGFFGMALQALIGGSSIMIVGASANVFGIAGAFLALFLRERMRILVSFFMVNNQTVVIPVIGYFGFWIVGEEIIGLMRTSSDGVAHLAHMGGFAAGFLTAKLLDRHPALPEGLVYPYEKDFLKQFDEAPDDEARIATLTQWLHANPASSTAAYRSLEVVSRLLDRGQDSQALSQFYHKAWPDLFERRLREEKFLVQVPISWLSASRTAVDLPLMSSALSQYHREQKDWCEWLVLYHVSMVAPPLPLAWDRRLDEVTKSLLQNVERVEQLKLLSRQNLAFRKFLEVRGIWIGAEGRGNVSS